MSRLLVLALTILPTVLLAEGRLLSRWAVELTRPTTALERFQEYRVGGLTLDGDTFYLADPYGHLERRSVTTGEAVWRVKLDAVSQSGWTKDGKEIFGGDTRGTVYSIDTESGNIKWKVSTKGVFFARPIVSESLVWVMNSLGTLQCYDRQDGTWQWQQTDPSITTVALWSGRGFTKVKDQIIAGFPSALLQAVDAKTGQLSWKESFSQLPSGSDSINDLKSVALQDDLLFASSFGGNLKAWSVKASQRKLLWEKALSLYAPISLDSDGNLYASGKDGSLQSFQAQNGFQRWKKDIPRGLATEPSLSKETVWVGTSLGEVLVYSKAGDLLARSNDYQSPIWNAPLLINDDEAIVLTTQGILRRLHFVSY